MGTAFAPAKVTSLVVEDNKNERLRIARKLSSSQAFEPVFYDNYQKHPLMQRAQDADIVSLDLEVENRRAESLFVCSQLKKQNPEKSVIFFTSSPEDVLSQPINFVLEKSKQVWESYDRLLMMILVHDRSFSLLREVVDLSGNREEIEEHYAEMREKLSPFISSLLTIQRVFKKEDRTIAKRYRRLTKVLKKIYSVGGDAENIAVKLQKMQEPLIGFVRQELADLKQFDGVYATPKLENEIVDLDFSIAHQPNLLWPKRTVGERMIVFAADRVADSFRSVSEYLKTGQTETAQTPETTSAAVEEHTLYLNAWFPDYEEKDSLTVYVPAELRVALDYLTTENLGTSAQISPEKAELLNTAGHVEVMVISPEADIDPLIVSLELPPEKEAFVKFTVTPRKEGSINLSVLLLIRNEPIYRTVFVCQALPAIKTLGLPLSSESSRPEVEVATP